MALLPATVPFNGQDVPLWTFAQLEQQNKQTLKQRALFLRDLIGVEQLPPLPSQASGRSSARTTKR